MQNQAMLEIMMQPSDKSANVTANAETRHQSDCQPISVAVPPPFHTFVRIRG